MGEGFSSFEGQAAHGVGYGTSVQSVSEPKAEPSGQHVSSLAPLGVWLRLIADNGGVPRRYWGKLARVLMISALAAPLRVAERVSYGPVEDGAGED